MNGTRGIVYKRCGCTDEKTGRQLAGRCPQLAEPGHGSWYLPPIRLHDLRHGAATLALASHTDLKVIQQMLGHSSIVTTADTYTSVLPETAHRAAQATADMVIKAARTSPGPNAAGPP
jgi:integrase